MRDYFFTSESVSEGHPDKVSDQISDAVLDTLLEQDPKSRVACETMTTTNSVIVAGEVSTQGYVDIEKVVRNTVKEIGYEEKGKGFDWETINIQSMIDEQSPDIAMGVDEGSEKEQVRSECVTTTCQCYNINKRNI